MTLVEVMISTAVFAVGLLGVFGIMGFSHTTAYSAQAQASGYQASRGLFEQLRGKPFRVIENSTLNSRGAPAGSVPPAKIGETSGVNKPYATDVISANFSLSEWGPLLLEKGSPAAKTSDGDQGKLIFSFFDPARAMVDPLTRKSPSPGVSYQALPVNSRQWTPLRGVYINQSLKVKAGNSAAEAASPAIEQRVEVALMISITHYDINTNSGSEGAIVELHYRVKNPGFGGERWTYGVSRTFIANTAGF